MDPFGGATNPARGQSNFPGIAPSDTADEEMLEKSDDGQAFQVADLLWSKKFCDLLTTQLDKVLSFDREPDLVTLTSTIPQDCTRAALFKLLNKRWQDGPGALEAVGFPDQIMTDPGLLVLVKMLPRKDRGGAAQRTAPQPARGRGTNTLRPAERKAQAEQGWMDVSTKLVAAWRKWLRGAALAKKNTEEYWELDPQDVTHSLPSKFQLHTFAKVIASYHIVWPKEAPAGLSIEKPSTLEIHYLYIEETNVPRKTVSYYARQAQTRLSERRTLDNSVWFDDMQAIPETDGLRSVDVFITHPHGTAADIMHDEMEDDIIVEVMTIEIKNPR